MRQETFSVLQALAEKHTGQFLHKNKQVLLAGRLTGLAFRTGHDSIDALARHIGDFRPGANLELEAATALLDRHSRFVPNAASWHRCSNRSSPPRWRARRQALTGSGAPAAGRARKPFPC